MQLRRKKSLYAVCGVCLLSFPLSIFAQGGQQAAATDQRNPVITAADRANQPVSAPAVGETASAELPDSPGATRSQEQNASQQAQDEGTRQQESSASQPSISEIQVDQAATPAPPQSQQKPQRPVGTAAAEAPMVSGVTAAQPAGVAIAPAKQRRVRTLVIKIGAIAGAAVALGTTMALTMGTPSKPPGAH